MRSSAPLHALEYLLCHYVKARYYPRVARSAEWTEADVRFFAPAVAQVSAAFTSERLERAKNYFNRKEFRSGYLLYFVLSNFPKAWQCLEQINAAARFAGRETVRVLDLGCGPGTGTLAALEYWSVHAPAQHLHCVGIDQNPEILTDARALFAGRASSPSPLPSPQGGRGLWTCETRAVDIGRKNLAQALRRETDDLIFAMNVLNEFGDLGARERLVRSLLDRHLAPDGVLILIEPGLQRMTRELMVLRDRLIVSQPPCQILAPCLHRDTCPMLKHNQRDWCHFYLNWERPRVIAQLDRLIGNKKDYLKFNYLILAKGSPSPQPPPQREREVPHRYRVVSAPLRSKGKTEILLCPAEGNDTSRLHRLTRLDKERGPANADLDRVVRGDIVTTNPSMSLRRADPFTIHARFQPP